MSFSQPEYSEPYYEPEYSGVLSLSQDSVMVRPLPLPRAGGSKDLSAASSLPAPPSPKAKKMSLRKCPSLPEVGSSATEADDSDTWSRTFSLPDIGDLRLSEEQEDMDMTESWILEESKKEMKNAIELSAKELTEETASLIEWSSQELSEKLNKGDEMDEALANCKETLGSMKRKLQETLDDQETSRADLISKLSMLDDLESDYRQMKRFRR